MNDFENIEVTIARVLSREANARDFETLSRWLDLSDENKKVFEDHRKLFEQAGALGKDVTVDTDKAWMQLKSRMHSRPAQHKIISMNNDNRWKTVLRVAAMVVVTAGLGYLAYLFMTGRDNAFDKRIVSNAIVRTEVLPDGSTFTLNRYSKLSYSSTSFAGKRVVRLEGEAFFEVKHDDANPFAVEAGELMIEDVGTSFNIKSYVDSGIIYITVATGEVKIYLGETEKINLAAGETVSFDRKMETFSKAPNEDKNIAAYRDKIFIFENTSLSVIIKLLNDIYGSNITLQNDALAQCRLTATFNNESLDNILDVIAETLHLSVTKTSSEIKLNGDGCK